MHKKLLQILAPWMKRYPGMTIRQMLVILYLGIQNKSVDFSEVKQYLGIPAAALTRCADSLCDKKIVFRKRSEEDTRRVFLSLTEDGKKFFKRIIP